MALNRIRIIFNPAAARGRARKVADRLRSALDTTSKSVEIDWVDTKHRGHAATLAREAAQAGFARVVAMGGDGTVHEVVNGLMQVDTSARPTLAIVPIGSGNDFALGANLERHPVNALRAAIERLDTEARWTDVGLVRDNLGRTEHFINVIGVGLDASVNYHAQQIELFHGFAMYFAALMRTLTNNYGSLPMELKIDGDQPMSRQVLMLAVANGTREGGGFRITPRADPSDGQLDLAMIGPVSRLRLLQIIPDVMAGTHERHPEIVISRIQQLRIRSSQPLLSHFDGEMFAWHEDGAYEMEISVVPQAIRLIG
ncbi:MAG: diacylglycerol/lipid kinase family protein [Anaerolineae bacterium]